MNKTPNCPDDILNSSHNIKPKFSPKDILKQSPDQEKIGDKTIEEQQKIHDYDPAEAQRKKDDLELKIIENNQKMKEIWSKAIGTYLFIFTFFMFWTLWFGCCLGIKPETLNFLIVAGFTKVIFVVVVIVKHLFPIPKADKKLIN